MQGFYSSGLVVAEPQPCRGHIGLCQENGKNMEGTVLGLGLRVGSLGILVVSTE